MLGSLASSWLLREGRDLPAAELGEVGPLRLVRAQYKTAGNVAARVKWCLPALLRELLQLRRQITLHVLPELAILQTGHCSRGYGEIRIWVS